MDFQAASIALARLLNQHQIRWAYGGSTLLYFIEIPVTPRDLDVVVHSMDVERAKALLIEAGATLLEEKIGSDQFLTKKFYTFFWDGMEIDFMATPGIQTNSRVYFMNFDEKGPWKKILSRDEDIYLCDPIDWIEYYGLMGNRELRVDQLKQYIENRK